MEFPMYHQSTPWHYLISSYSQLPENHIHWTRTPESHIYSVDLPGVKKHEIKVELEDSRYLVIRTEAINNDEASGSGSGSGSTTQQPAKKFKRKFRLPGMIDIEGISAGYENGVLTVTVPRTRTRGFYIDPSDLPHSLHVLARAA